MDYEIKDNNVEPIELIMCQYCGARLNRVGKGLLLPTSCHDCGHDRFEPKIIKVMEVVAETPINLQSYNYVFYGSLRFA